VEEPAGRGSDRRGGWSRPPPSTPPLQPAALPPRTRRRKAGPAQKQRDGDAPLRLSSPVRDAPQNAHTLREAQAFEECTSGWAGYEAHINGHQN